MAENAALTGRHRLLVRNEQVAALRFAATRQRVLAGDLAAIDSVEALTELLPKFSVDYNLLLPGRPLAFEGRPQPFQGGYSANNYKLGLSLAYPILLRAERAKRQLTQLKLRDTALQLDQDQRQTSNALQTAANDRQALRE